MLFEPKGCKACNEIGYKGRVAIYELLKVTEAIQELIGSEVGQLKIKEAALQKGMVTMQQDGILKVVRGITTPEEVAGVTGELLW